MSSQNRDDDADKPSPPPSPWASELQRRDEARRLQDEVIAAAQKLERQSLELKYEERAAFGLEPPRPKFEIARLRPRDLTLQDSPRGLWTPALDPVSMPLPPQERIGLASPGMVVGLVGVVGVAAAIALLIAHTLQMEIKPASPIVSMSSESGAGKSRSFAAVADNMPRIAAAEPTATVPPAQVIAPPAQVTVPPAQVTVPPAQAAVPPAQAAVPPAQVAATATAAVAATAATADVALAKPSVMAPPPAPTVEAATAKVEPAQPEATKPEATKPAASVIPDPRPSDSLSRDAIASLLKRGQDMITAGDIASGRLFLTRAALAGNADASLALAGTFDAAVLANLRAVGVQPDPAKAQAWYARAAEQGSLEAKRRLQQSAGR
jgi:hypothetical protein